MQILYNSKTDLVALRPADRKQSVTNNRVRDEVVLDIGEDNRIVDIEFLDASHQLDLANLLAVNYRVTT